jgi:hypothetical protein
MISNQKKPKQQQFMSLDTSGGIQLIAGRHLKSNMSATIYRRDQFWNYLTINSTLKVLCFAQ